MNRILILGSTSTVGRVVGRLLEKNNSAFYAGRKNTDFHFDLCAPDFHEFSNLTFDIVIHTAAMFGSDTEEDMIQMEKVNAIGTMYVCQLARRVKVSHLIIVSKISTSYLTGDAYYNIYSLSKRHSDELAQLYCSAITMPLTILRPSQLYDSNSQCKNIRSFYT